MKDDPWYHLLMKLTRFIFIIILSFSSIGYAFADDFSGAWSGIYTATNYGNGGNLTATIYQTGSSLSGIMSITGTNCSNLNDIPLSGNVSNNIAWINLSYNCMPSGDFYEFYFTNGTLVNNNITGSWYVNRNSSFYANGTFNLSRLPNCSYSISPSSYSYSSSGGSTTVSVDANYSSCSWIASEGLSWVTLSTSGGTGNGSVTVTVSANTGDARNGSITIAGQVYTLSQEALVTYDWYTGDWSICTAECGGGIQTRIVQCQDSIGNIVADENCSAPKPYVLQACNIDPCLGVSINGDDQYTADDGIIGLRILAGQLPGEAVDVNADITGDGKIGLAETIYNLARAEIEKPPGTVTSAGQVWMDYNLGASRVATSSTDAEAYGDLYQWGRGTDGHEKRTSGTTSKKATSDTPGHGLFITDAEANPPIDWRTPQNDNLWQGVSGINNPCPAGFRLPTETELETEVASWASHDSACAYGSPLKLVVAGSRYFSGELSVDVGSVGSYWSSTVEGNYSRVLSFFSSNALIYSDGRLGGNSVRCFKD